MPYRTALVQQLFDTLHATLPYYDQPDAVLNRSYAPGTPGKWTMREILCHLSDNEAVFLDRLRRLASEPNPTLMNMDENAWAVKLSYQTRDLPLVRAQQDVVRRSVIELARTLDETVDNNAGTHSTAGRRTFGQILAGVVSHNAHHLEQLKAIAENRPWTPKK